MYIKIKHIAISICMLYCISYQVYAQVGTPVQKSTLVKQDRVQTTNTTHLLKRIPHQSWFIFALHQVSQSFTHHNLNQGYQDLYQKLNHYFTQKFDPQNPEFQTLQDLQLIWKNLHLPPDLKAWQKNGVKELPLMFLYSIDYMPSLMIQLPADDYITTWWTQQNHLKTKFTAHQKDQQHYWKLELKRWVLIVQRWNRVLQMTWVPKAYVQQQLSKILDPPTQNIIQLWQTKNKKIQTLNPNSDLSGWIQFQRIVDNMIKLPSSLPRDIILSLGVQKETLNACQSEIKTLTQHMPTLTLASVSSTKKAKQKVLFLLELSKQFNQFFKQLTSNLPPPLPATPDFHLSLSLKLSSLFEQLIQISPTWSQKPWQCSLLKNLNVFTALTQHPAFMKWRALLQAFQGFSLHIDHAHNSDHLQAWIGLHYPHIQVPLGLFKQHPQSPSWLKQTTFVANAQATPIQAAPKTWVNPQISLSSQGLIMSSGYKDTDIHKKYHQQRSLNNTAVKSQNIKHLFTLYFSDESIKKIQLKVAQLKNILQGKSSPKKEFSSSIPNKSLAMSYINLKHTNLGILIEQEWLYQQ